MGRKSKFNIGSVNDIYRRTSRWRACKICGKTDWCSYTPDEKISFCARIVENADRISRTGWGVFHHEKSGFSDRRLPRFPSQQTTKKTLPAPLEIRHFAYQKLIELSPASESSEIIDGAKGLRERSILDFENYGSLPPKSTERHALAKIIRHQINRTFPDYVRENKSSISRVPGFWLDTGGKARIFWDTNYDFPLLLIPYRRADGLIEACQIRFMSDRVFGARYLWLSVPDQSGGISSGSPLHFARFGEASPERAVVMVTEGALKAETVKRFNPGLHVIGSGGVNCAHHAIIAAARFRPLILAFDSDYTKNIHIARAIAKLALSRLEDCRGYDYDFNLSVVSWDASAASGIDEALMQRLTLCEISLFNWFDTLGGKSRSEIYEILKPVFQSPAAEKSSIAVSTWSTSTAGTGRMSSIRRTT